MAHKQIGAVRPTASEQGGCDASSQTSWFDRSVLPYLEESTRWPVLIVVLVHVAALLAPLILRSLRDRGVAAMAAMALLIVLSLRVFVGDSRRRRFGPLSGLILVTWMLSAVIAYFADQWLLF